MERRFKILEMEQGSEANMKEKKFKIHFCDQRSVEWFKIRANKFTATDATAVKNNKAGLKTAVRDIVSEKYSSGERESFSNTHMDRGKETEAEAVTIFEFETGLEVTEVGFCELDEHTGCSPDGLILAAEEGLEIKCLTDPKYIDTVLTGKYETDYYAQCQFSLYVTGFKAWYLCFYNPNFTKTINIFRIEPDEQFQELIRIGLESGKEKLKEAIAEMEKFLGIKEGKKVE